MFRAIILSSLLFTLNAAAESKFEKSFLSKSANLSLVQAGIGKILSCFREAKSVDTYAICASRYDSANYKKNENYKRFFKHKLKLYCDLKKIDNCGLVKSKGFQSFFDFFYSPFGKVHTPHLKEKKLFIGGVSCKAFTSSRWNGFFHEDENVIKLSCGNVTYSIALSSKDDSLKTIRLDGFEFRKLHKSKAYSDNTKITQIWALENSQMILRDLNRPYDCFSVANNLTKLLACIQKYDLYLSHESEGFVKKHIFEPILLKYCKNKKMKNCTTKDDRLWYKVIKRAYNGYFNKIKSLGEAIFKYSPYRGGSKYTISVDFFYDKECEYRSFNTLVYEKSKINRGPKIYNIEEDRCYH
jgi:hypothetical protein